MPFHTWHGDARIAGPRAGPADDHDDHAIHYERRSPLYKPSTKEEELRGQAERRSLISAPVRFPAVHFEKGACLQTAEIIFILSSDPP